MTTTITAQEIIRGLEHQRTGLQTPRYSATWRVQTDKYATGPTVVTLARSGTPALPFFGSTLNWTYDSVDTSYTDTSAFALDFSTTIVDSMPATTWDIEVTWRAPEPGEDPESQQQLPLNRPARHTLEWNDTEEDVSIGAKVWHGTIPPAGNDPDDVTKAALRKGLFEPATGETLTQLYNALVLSEDQVMINGASEPLPPVQWTKRLPVVVAHRNVASPKDCIDIQQTFGNTTNLNDFTIVMRIAGQTYEVPVRRFHARFLGADLGAETQEQGQTFFPMQIRVELGVRPYFLWRENVGSYYFDQVYADIGGAVPKRFRYDDGTFYPGPYALDIDGTLATKPSEHSVFPYLVLYTAPYGDLMN